MRLNSAPVAAPRRISHPIDCIRRTPLATVPLATGSLGQPPARTETQLDSPRLDAPERRTARRPLTQTRTYGRRDPRPNGSAGGRPSAQAHARAAFVSRNKSVL